MFRRATWLARWNRLLPRFDKVKASEDVTLVMLFVVLFALGVVCKFKTRQKIGAASAASAASAMQCADSGLALATTSIFGAHSIASVHN
jgi:hypothetical protein